MNATDEEEQEAGYTDRAPDAVLLSLRLVAEIAVRKKKTPPALPADCLLSLCDELIDRRSVANGAIQEIMARNSQQEGRGMLDRPSDTALRAFADMHREIALAGGLGQVVEIEAIALVTLAEELIESRKAPRA